MTAITTVPRVGRIAVHAARLFDGRSSTILDEPVVVVEDGRIAEVRAGSVPTDATVVELPDVTLLPGLIDTHVHLCFDASADPVGALLARGPDAVVEQMVAAAGEALRGGVTTVRDLGDLDYLSLQLRGRPGLPTIVSAGPPLTTSAGHCHYLGGAVVRGAAGVRQAVREHAERGTDVIKVMASGGNLTPGTAPETAQFELVELQAIVDEAHHLGLPVTAHAHGTAAIGQAVQAGVDGLEHATFWTADGIDWVPALIDRIAARRLAVGATLGLRPVPGAAPPPAVLARIPGILANLRRLVSAGAVVVAGTDAGIAPNKPPDAARYAFADLITAGLAPVDALRRLTSTAAEICGLADRKGRIEPGFDADLLAVEGDPIADPQALHRIRAVYLAGVPVVGAGTASSAPAGPEPRSR